MDFIRGQRVRLASGVERPESEHGEVDEGVVDGRTPFGDVLVSLPGIGGELFHPAELIPTRRAGPGRLAALLRVEWFRLVCR